MFSNRCPKDCNECKHGCRPAEYDCGMFDLQVDPFDPTKWHFVIHGMTYTVNAPGWNETDTTLSINYPNATLNYKAEKHNDIITGSQLGDIINLEDLRDVDFDSTIPGNCYELIFHKFTECGEGCRSAADRWQNWNVNDEGAKQKSIHYVRGANEDGCPIYLDEPAATDQYWFGMWDPTSENGFTYVQPVEAELPKNANGDPIVMSTDPTTGKPIKGVIPLSCYFGNLMKNLGVEVFGNYRIVTGTPGLSSAFDPASGAFSITYNDWIYSLNRHVGTGVARGKVNWTTNFDANTGNMVYTITSIYFQNFVYTTDQGVPAGTTPIHLNLYSISQPSGSQQTLINNYEYSGSNNFTININQTIQSNFTVAVGPGQSSSPVEYARLYLDWVNDDDVYTRINFRNKISDWTNC